MRSAILSTEGQPSHSTLRNTVIIHTTRDPWDALRGTHEILDLLRSTTLGDDLSRDEYDTVLSIDKTLVSMLEAHGLEVA